MSTYNSTKVLSKKGTRPERLVLEPVRPVLKPVRRQPTWTMEATTPTSASSYLSEEEWPATTPTKEGRPTLGLMPKKSSSRPVSPPNFTTRDKKITWSHAPSEQEEDMEAKPASTSRRMDMDTDSEDRENSRPSNAREETTGARRKRNKRSRRNKESARDLERPDQAVPSKNRVEPEPSQQKRARLDERTPP